MSTRLKTIILGIFVLLVIVMSFISPRTSVGILITGLAFLGLLYNEWLIRQTGTFAWAERYIRTEGGTRLMLKIICIIALMIGLLTVVGLHEDFMRWIFGRLIQYNQMAPDAVQ